MLSGSTAVVSLADEAEQIAGRLRGTLPVDDPSYEYAIELAGLALARSRQHRRYMAELEQAFEDGEIDLADLREKQLAADQGLNRVMRTGLALLNSLAATPRSRAEFLRDAGIGRAAGLRAEAAEKLREHVEAKARGDLHMQAGKKASSRADRPLQLEPPVELDP